MTNTIDKKTDKEIRWNVLPMRRVVHRLWHTEEGHKIITAPYGLPKKSRETYERDLERKSVRIEKRVPVNYPLGGGVF